MRMPRAKIVPNGEPGVSEIHRSWLDNLMIAAGAILLASAVTGNIIMFGEIRQMKQGLYDFKETQASHDLATDRERREIRAEIRDIEHRLDGRP